ncbi:hypothetical protein HRR80_007414 [Exophiala dermatitidis]|uniref:Uncharacterized protein n=1 Tax=Exophiala dermatitidis TaxID=5970 RepID=A0AAN6IRZ9_EXODE|nr:hypothetical protein HRR77_005254 [Exophiala dermatitidis]KAJ4571722.1 hypothetical protein HRR82_007010 [Exophiala dermatitidis]KAJ4616287.1 hypothetical protein HRR85_003145 [Exophiala dermatitidis]KAJ4618044.1 hypothetical protein HRR86_007164 [Exophiala dermatitidis]KAJ8988382.1 hypothetical protein HRR80_007414 [Exophiala dermatitidis]
MNIPYTLIYGYNHSEEHSHRIGPETKSDLIFIVRLPFSGQGCPRGYYQLYGRNDREGQDEDFGRSGRRPEDEEIEMLHSGFMSEPKPDRAKKIERWRASSEADPRPGNTYSTMLPGEAAETAKGWTPRACGHREASFNGHYSLVMMGASQSPLAVPGLRAALLLKSFRCRRSRS